ncbi:MAG: KamA family radical SAM protein [Leptospiraceae bacterium]|nr:KamA family radical SAM protein [Leptospiraceae bacterium]
MNQNWNNWKWQMQNRATTISDLEKYIELTEEEREVFSRADDFFEFGSTPYYLSLVDKNNPNCPIRKQIVPSSGELVQTKFEVMDPLAEESHMPVKGVTHRYPDRALWYISSRCAVFCRFCTRKRKVGQNEFVPDNMDWKKALEYFSSKKEIKEVILSGGDPLSISDSKIDYLLTELKKISHINHIRIHTRYPVTLPYRITLELCEIFAKHFPIFMVTHFNHPKELTKDAEETISMLIKKGNVVLLNQSVLLSGINDSAIILKELFYGLVRLGVKPYYLHQCDEVFGSTNFRVPITKGINIMKQLRGYMSGVTIPTYVADLTGGGGKVPLPTDYLIKEEVETYRFQNFSGKEFSISK